MPTPEEQREYLLAQLKVRSQNSWDWEADEDFAQFLQRGDIASEIRCAIDSGSVLAFRVAYFEVCGGAAIKKIRLRRLRELERQGRVASGWVGIGPGGYYEFGIRRVKWYALAKPN